MSLSGRVLWVWKFFAESIKIASIFPLHVKTASLINTPNFQSCEHGFRRRVNLHLSWGAHCCGMLSGQCAGDVGRVEEWSPEPNHFLPDCVAGDGWFPGWSRGRSSGCSCGRPCEDPFPCLSVHQLCPDRPAASVSGHPPGHCCGSLSASLYPIQVSRPPDDFEMICTIGFKFVESTNSLCFIFKLLYCNLEMLSCYI